MLMLWTGFGRPNKVVVGAIKLGGSQVAVVKFMTRAHMPKAVPEPANKQQRTQVFVDFVTPVP